MQYTRREEPTITMMMKFELKLPITKSLKFISAKMSKILETLNILAANISSFTVYNIYVIKEVNSL